MLMEVLAVGIVAIIAAACAAAPSATTPSTTTSSSTASSTAVPSNTTPSSSTSSAPQATVPAHAIDLAALPATFSSSMSGAAPPPPVPNAPLANLPVHDLATKVASLKARGLHGAKLYNRMSLMEVALYRTLLEEPCSDEESVTAATCLSEMDEDAPLSPTSVFSLQAASSPAWSTHTPYGSSASTTPRSSENGLPSVLYAPCWSRGSSEGGAPSSPQEQKAALAMQCANLASAFDMSWLAATETSKQEQQAMLAMQCTNLASAFDMSWLAATETSVSNAEEAKTLVAQPLLLAPCSAAAVSTCKPGQARAGRDCKGKEASSRPAWRR